ncbi:MAG TPA: DUF1080 domain-containing protein [Chitinophagaceae bacterium]|nr:DUF1080 domain-containing protein [Chitinophagaceae bacterium]
MKNRLSGKMLLIVMVSFLFASVQLHAQALNTLSKREKKQGWRLLFNGKDLTGWHIYLQPDAKPGWSVSDGAIMTDFNNGGVKRDLVTNEEFENYELTLQWKIEEGGNSGIIFNVHEDPKYSATYVTGPEMQVLDNVKASDNKKDNHLAGSLYDLIAADPSAVHPAGEWNTVIIKMNKGLLQLFMNGKKVVETTLWNDQWKEMVANSKFKKMPAFGSFQKGRIALQYHGGEVWFRNIKIRAL